MDHANDNLRLMIGDCLERMKEIPDGSVDLVLTDPPYGTTACKWDAVIEFTPMWDNVRRVLKPNGAAVFTASQPFTSALVMSNVQWFKYSLVYEKSHPTGHLNANRAPMRKHEDIAVFGKSAVIYNPQKTPKPSHNVRPATRGSQTESYGVFDPAAGRTDGVNVSFPNSILRFNVSSTGGDKGLHPTQKPVALMEYLIRTYTNPDDTVLDFTMGSGTTGVACANTGRRFIGIERDEAYFEIARKRIVTAFDPPVADNDNQADLFA